MEEPKIRGYAVPLAARFILDDKDLRARLSADVIEDLKRVAASKPDVWMPRIEAMRLWCLVDEASPDEETAYLNLVRCGESIADQAISTFLKLLLRVLSPTQFARKFPDIWAHEHTKGFVEAALSDDNKGMVINIHDVEGFRHVGPIGVGFVGTALRALGLKELKLRDVTWTRAKPDSSDVRMEISWK